jgi:hypothetical protein
MKRRLLALLLGALGLLLPEASSVPANAAIIYIRESSSVCPAGSYVGPGDVEPGALVFYGVRAYNASYAAGCNPAIDITGGNVPIRLLPNGNLDMSRALSVGGVSGTGSCTISGTTMLCATGTGTLAQYGNITGAGLTYPAFQSGTSCSSFPCTVTLAQSQTVVSAETITSYAPMMITQFYDQSGAGSCSGPCNTGDAGSVNYLIANCLNSHPCVWVNAPAAPVGQGGWEITNFVSTGYPLTNTFVGERIGSTSSYGMMWSFGASVFYDTWYTSPNTLQVAGGGSNFTVTANDNTPHSMTFLNDGASSVANIDGTETTGNSGTLSAFTTYYFLQDSFGHPVDGYVGEGGMWGTAMSQANRTLLCGNMAGYWGTAVGLRC